MSKPDDRSKLKGPKTGVVRGSFVIRDAAGNVKGRGQFAGSATSEQIKDVMNSRAPQ